MHHLPKTAKEAKKIGFKQYLTGIPCAHGHIAPRLTINNVCCECGRIRSRRYCQENKDKKKKYKEENKERLKETNKMYYENNKEKICAKTSAWKKANRERVNSVRKVWREENAERDREANKAYRDEWVRNNRDRLTALQNKRQAEKKKRIPKWANLDDIYELYKEAKELTISTGIDHQVDHIVPLLGKTVCGLHVAYNMRVVTKQENQAKHNKLIEELL